MSDHDAERSAEFARRIGAVRAVMADEGYDVIVASDTGERHIPGGHVRYLADFTAAMLHSAVVVPLVGEVTLVVQPGSRSCFPLWAADESWITDIRSTPTDRWPPRQLLGPDVANAISDVGLSAPRVGMCGTFPGSDELDELLPKAEFVPAVAADGRGTGRDLVERVRAVKSDWEVVRLREAQRYVEFGMRAFMASIEPGRKWVRSVAEAEWASKSQGADDFFVYMVAAGGSDAPWIWWTEQDQRVFAAGDLVAAEANARCDGYLAQIARSGTIGKARPEQSRITGASADALAAMAETLRAGVTGAELYETGAAVIRKAGLSPNARFGHGMGISMAESFDVMPHDEQPLADGYCVELHPGVTDTDRNQSALIGDQFMIRDGRGVLMSEAFIPRDFGPAD